MTVARFNLIFYYLITNICLICYCYGLLLCVSKITVISINLQIIFGDAKIKTLETPSFPVVLWQGLWM